MSRKRTAFLLIILIMATVIQLPVPIVRASELVVSISDDMDDVWMTESGNIFSSVFMVMILDTDIGIRSFLRFRDLEIANSALINYATLKVYVAETQETPDPASSVTIYGIDEPDCSPFTVPGSGLWSLSRPYTSASVNWNTSDWAGYEEVNVTDIVKEIINQYAWSYGNDLGFQILGASGSGQHPRSFEDFYHAYHEGQAVLTIVYDVVGEGEGPPPDPGDPEPDLMEQYGDVTIWRINGTLPFPPWEYRQPIEVKNLTGAGTNYQVEVGTLYDGTGEMWTSFTKANQYNPLPDIPLNGADGSLHPDVLYFPEGMDGYRYWMSYTPYPPGAKEEPSLVRSNNGTIWTEAGIANPVIAMGAWDETIDPDILYVPELSRWFMVYGRHETAVSTTIYLATSTNGTVWTEYGEIIDGSEAYEVDDTPIPAIMEPTMIYEDGVFYLWYDALNTEANINNRRWMCLATFEWNNGTGSVVNFQRDAGNPILHQALDGTFQAGQGHIDVTSFNGTYNLYALRWITALPGQYDMCYWNSTDKTTWAYQGVVIDRGLTGQWDEQYVYRGGPVTDGVGEVALFGNKVVIYYSGAPPPGTLPGMGIAYSYRGGLNLHGVARTDFGDVRFTESDGITELDYWLQEDYVEGEYATFWVEVTHNLTESGTTIYCYYGYPGASTTSDGWTTFPVFDDFNDEALNATTWNSHKSGSANALVDELASGQLELGGEPGVTSSGAISTNQSLTNDFELRLVHEIDEEHYSTSSIGNASLQDEDGGVIKWWQTVMGDGYSWMWQSPVSGETPLPAGDVSIRESPDGGAIVILEALDAGSLTTLNENHTLAMQYFSDGTLRWFHDDTFWLEGQDITYLSLPKVALISQGEHGPSGNGGSKLVDWAFIRKLVEAGNFLEATEPTIGASDPEVDVDDIYIATDENGTVIKTWNGDNFTDIDDLKDWIDDYVDPRGGDPLDPTPGTQGWTEEGPFTRFKMRLYFLVIGLGCIFGPLLAMSYRRPGVTGLAWCVVIMIIGLGLLISIPNI